MRSVLFAAAALVASSGATARAQVDEVRVGLALHDLGVISSNKEDGVALSGEVLFSPAAGLSWLGSPRPFVGLSVATDDEATSQFYAGLGWRLDFASRVFADVGFGLAVHDGETDFDPGEPLLADSAYLGCRVLARLSGDVGYRMTERLSASFHVAHSSNAGICDENEGLDATGLRLGYRF